MDDLFKKLHNDLVVQIYPEQLPLEIADSLTNLIDEVEDEEFKVMMEELQQFLTALGEDISRSNWPSIIVGYMSGINWENYNDKNEHGEVVYYTLGGVWYNRLQWMMESEEEERLSDFAKLVEPTLVKLMDELEKLTNKN